MIVGTGPRVRWVIKPDWKAKLYKKTPNGKQSVQLFRNGEKVSHPYFSGAHQLTADQLDAFARFSEARECLRDAEYAQLP